MSYFEVQINSTVAEIRNGEPFVFRFAYSPNLPLPLNKLRWAYINQAYWLIESARHENNTSKQARLFGKAAYAMRQAVQVESWERILEKKKEQSK